MQTDTTSQETHNLIASDRVEGTPVRSTDGTTIGTIERVMIDKLAGNVAYAVLSFVGVGQRRLSIPWRQLTYDRKLAAYHLDLTENEISAMPQGSDVDWGGTAAVKSNATVMTGRKSIGELPKVGENLARDQAAAWI